MPNLISFMKHFLILLVALVFTRVSIAQVYPAEASRLNYRLVVFSVPDITGNNICKLSIARGAYRKQQMFEKNIIRTLESSEPQLVTEVPDFDAVYTWQIEYGDNSKTPLYHFSTTGSVLTDPARFRLSIIEDKYHDSAVYFFLDYARSMYNMNGEKVWYLPDIPGKLDSSSRVRDLKLSPFGTITFLTDTSAYEVSYDGRLLWQAPPTGQGLYYHHEFSRLRNGNYMILGLDEAYRKIPSDSLTLYMNKDAVKREDGYYKRILFSTILEYAPDKKLIWKWSAADYFTDTNLSMLRMENGTFMASIRMNGFYFNEEKRVIYAGFRDVSRILKISYPAGKLITAYGKHTASSPSAPFSCQHSYNIDRNGDLLIYNNNVIRAERSTVSAIQIFKEPRYENDTLTKLWEYPCDIDDKASSLSAREGNVAELPDGNIMCCMGTSQRIFVVGKNKEILFNALSEKWNRANNTWDKFPQYRISVFKRNDLIKNLN
jgi:hypothetical protein